MTASSHDKLFKGAFGEPTRAAQELRFVLPPAIVQHLDLTALQPVPGSFLEANFKHTHSDLLFAAPLAGRDARVYILFEHKSYNDKHTPLQLLHSIAAIWQSALLAEPPPEFYPPVIPVVVHHSRSGWQRSTSLDDLLDPIIHQLPELQRLTPRFEFLLDDFSHATDAELRARALDAYATLALLFLRDARIRDRLITALRTRWGDLMTRLIQADSNRQALGILMSYAMQVVEDLRQEDLELAIRDYLPDAKEFLMTLAQQLRQEGMERGTQQGPADRPKRTTPGTAHREVRGARLSCPRAPGSGR